LFLLEFIMGFDTIGGIMKTILTVILALSASTAFAQATQCQTFSDGVTICYPVGGGSSFGR
jgi:hypothetical protein